MKCTEKIIGFDAREMWHFDKEDDVLNKALKENITKVLSVDSSIWGSVFNDGEYPDIKGTERDKYGLGELDLPEEIGVNRPLWARLSDLKACINKNIKRLKKPIFIIAITKIVERFSEKVEENQWPYTSHTSPEEIGSGWTLIGYDVNTHKAEYSIANTLSQSLKESDSISLVLNQYCLFNNIEEAKCFKELEDKLYPKDGPHIVFGIWLIEKIEI